MTTYRINFTKTAIDAIKPPVKSINAKGGIYDTYYDQREKGLILIVSNGGSKTFYLYSKVTGKPERLKLGRHPEMSVENARKAAVQARGQISSGKSPKVEKDRIKNDMRFADFFEQHFMKRYSEPFKKSYKYDLEQYRLHLTPLKDKKLLHITRGDIEKMHSDIGSRRGIYAANHALALVKVVFSKAIEWGWEGQNPSALVRKFKQKSRERFLLPEELPLFFQALDSEANEGMKDYFYLCLLTGARKSNVMAMHWEDISFVRETWTIPDTKNGESHSINLMPEAIEILENRRNKKQDGWVFPSATSRSGHMEEPKSAWRRILSRTELFQLIQSIGQIEGWTDLECKTAEVKCKDDLSSTLKYYREQAKKLNIDIDGMGLRNLRIHDLRRTLGSWQAITGANQYIIGKSLGHKSTDATEIYARLYNDPVKESLKRATKAMFSAGRTL